jgi:hypothetical protein
MFDAGAPLYGPLEGMGVRYFAVVIAYMLFGGAVTLVLLGLLRHSDEEREIMLSDKSYWEYGPDPRYILISGTLTGEGIAYKNNTHNILCDKERRVCTVVSIEQIGPNQMGSLDYVGNYSITKWDAHEVVAVDPLPSETFDWHCQRTTITIARQTKNAVWVREPINQTKTGCAKSDTAIRKWTIEDSPGWRRLRTQ